MILLIGCSIIAEIKDDKNNLMLFFAEIATMGHEDLSASYYIYDVKTKEKRKSIANEIIVASDPPVISEDGKLFAYYYEKNGKKAIRLSDTDKNKLLIDEEIQFSVYDKDFTKDYIVVSGNATRHYYGREIYMINIRTNEITRITNNNVMDYGPVISPNNDALIFLQVTETKTYLIKYSFTNEKLKTIYTFEGYGYNLFQWLKSDKVLLTRKDNYGTPFLFDLESFNIVDLNLDNISEIKISPDEKMIAYLQGRKDAEYILDLYISDIDGENAEKVIIDENIDIVAPQWFMQMND